MGKAFKILVAVAALLCLFIAGGYAQAQLLATEKPTYSVLIPYDTYMGNIWQVKELPDILQVLAQKHVVALVYYPYQDVGKIIEGLSGDVILLSDKNVNSNKRVLWINVGTIANENADVDLSYESLVSSKDIFPFIQGKKLCTRDDLMTLTSQYLWSKTTGIFSAKDCPSDGQFIGYSPGSEHPVVTYDVKTTILSLLSGQRLRKVVKV